MSYILDRELKLPYREVAEILSRPCDGQPLIFIDDCTLSGTQAIHIFSEMLGVWRHKPYKYATALSDAELRNLRKSRIEIVSAIGTNLSAMRLDEFLSMHDLAHRIQFARFIPWLSEDGIRDLGKHELLGDGEEVREPSRQLANPIFGPGSRLSRPSEWESAMNLCSQIGYELLSTRASRKGWTEERRRGSSLGYSGMQGRLVFSHNVPKTTLTLLWESGVYRNRPWIPLFPSRD